MNLGLPYGYDRWLTTPPEPTVVCCPICGEECHTIYKDNFGDIFGCENCVTEHDACEVLKDE